MTKDELKGCTDRLKEGKDITFKEADGIFNCLYCSKAPDTGDLLLEWYEAVLNSLKAGKKGNFVNSLPLCYIYAYLYRPEIARTVSQCLDCLDPLERTSSCLLGLNGGKVISKEFGRAFAVKREFQDQDFVEVCKGEIANGCRLWHDIKKHPTMNKRDALLKIWGMPQRAEVKAAFEAAFIEYMCCRKNIPVMVFKMEYGLLNRKNDYRGEYSLAVPRAHVSTAYSLYSNLLLHEPLEYEYAYFMLLQTVMTKPCQEPKDLKNVKLLDCYRDLTLVFDGKYLYLAMISPDDEKTGKKGERYFYKFKTIDILKELMDLFDAMVENANESLRQKEEAINDDSYLDIIR